MSGIPSESSIFPPLPPQMPPNPPRTGSSAILKILAIGVLGTCLLVPLTLIWALITERSTRRDEVVSEVTASVGKAQTVGGIVLALPYDVLQRRDTDGSTYTVTQVAYVHPEKLSVEATLSPELRHRSQYRVVVYRTVAKLTGTIAPPDLTRLGANATAIHWDKASVQIEITDLRGTVHVSPLTWGESTVTLEPMTDGAVFQHGVRGPTPLTPGTTASIPFGVALTLAGSETLKFVPTGKATDVSLSAPWATPGFSGAFLPIAQTTTGDAFRAKWQVSYLARSFQHSWLGCTVNRDTLAAQRLSSTFGVNLVEEIDHYRQTERAVKYGLLFVLLTFTVFLLWELLKDLRLHPVQYVLIGAALVVFYLLLLSLSEQMAFALAYAIAAGATIALVSGYAASVLRAGFRGAAGIGTWLGALYGVLFVLLRLEDLALLVGSVFVFLVLAAVMYLTRRFDWTDVRATA